jgi:hypothetical protein
VIDDELFDEPELEDALVVEAPARPNGVTCATCGRPLGTDPEGEPDGDAGLPICGECNRERNFAAIEEVDLLD